MQKLLEIGLTNAVLATLLACLAFTIGRAFRRPAITHTLWLLVLLKLLTPPLIAVPIPWPAALGATLAKADVPQAEAAALVRDQSPTEEEDAQMTDDFVADQEAILTTPAASYRTPGPDVEAASAPPSDETSGAYLIGIGVLWLAGSVLWLVTAGVRIVRFHRLLGCAQPAPAALQAEAHLLALGLGLPRCPEIWIVPGRISPLLWALAGRVRLVLPAELLSRLQPEQQATLLAHELAHALRHDHWVRWLELLATGLYWWHPVAWWARHEIQHAEEQCCDAWVVWLLPAAAKAYAKALLQTVDFLDARPALPPVASGIGHVYHLKRRLTMIVRNPLSPRLPWGLHLGTVLLGLLVLPIAPERLEAQSSTQLAALFQDEPRVTASSSEEPELRDLDRRLRRLEQRMDRVLRSLEERGGQRSDRVRETEEKSIEIAKEARQKALKVQKEALAKAKEMREKVKKEADRAKEFKFRFEADGNLDPERLKKALQKQIESAVKEAINPERMQQMEKQIEETIKKSINPERMKQLEKQIEVLVQKNINPERMEALGKQIEALVDRSLNAEQREKVRQAERARAPERPKKPTEPSAARQQRGPASADRRDLERRLDKLEEKMDRLLRALESSRKQE